MFGAAGALLLRRRRAAAPPPLACAPTFAASLPPPPPAAAPIPLRLPSPSPRLPRSAHRRGRRGWAHDAAPPGEGGSRAGPRRRGRRRRAGLAAGEGGGARRGCAAGGGEEGRAAGGREAGEACDGNNPNNRNTFAPAARARFVSCERGEMLEHPGHRRHRHVDDALQRLHDLRHGGPVRLLVLDAPARHPARALQLPLADVPPQPRVRHRGHVPLHHPGRRPHREERRGRTTLLTTTFCRLRVPVPVAVAVAAGGVAAAGDELEEQHAEAVDVGLGADGQAGDPLRREVPDGAPHGGQGAAEVPPHELGHPEVGDLGAQVPVQQHVLRLHVAVDDALPAAVVQVGQSPGDAEHDARTRQLGQLLPNRKASSEPLGMYSYTSILSSPEEQKPRSRTRLTCWMSPSVFTSARNCFSPCRSPSSFFTATSTWVWPWPFVRTPRYTVPKPPPPSLSEKFFVAARRSLQLYTCSDEPFWPAISARRFLLDASTLHATAADAANAAREAKTMTRISHHGLLFFVFLAPCSSDCGSRRYRVAAADEPPSSSAYSCARLRKPSCQTAQLPPSPENAYAWHEQLFRQADSHSALVWAATASGSSGSFMSGSSRKPSVGRPLPPQRSGALPAAPVAEPPRTVGRRREARRALARRLGPPVADPEGAAERVDVALDGGRGPEELPALGVGHPDVLLDLAGEVDHHARDGGVVVEHAGDAAVGGRVGVRLVEEHVVDGLGEVGEDAAGPDAAAPAREPFQRRKNSLLLVFQGSTVSVNAPGAGSSASRQDVSVWYSPVVLSSPSHASGTSVSVGWSKLCQSTREDELPPPSRSTRFPSSRITATFDDDDDDDALVDHTTTTAEEGGWVVRPTSWRLPSSGETRSSAESALERGLARLATQMTNRPEPPGLKRPSSNLPCADTAVSLPRSGRRADTVSSPAAAAAAAAAVQLYAARMARAVAAVASDMPGSGISKTARWLHLHRWILMTPLN
ncbi:LOW QUALITY PROTEIN: hypothetical protein U9M48_020157 [Paspalum notatum var. saurae]|uniref:Uncharacterized protein n=1 Tax=Paspalum notatum var. saurae TaxID=547442 RepID=A0AAQ3TFG1_PASNO